MPTRRHRIRSAADTLSDIEDEIQRQQQSQRSSALTSVDAIRRMLEPSPAWPLAVLQSQREQYLVERKRYWDRRQFWAGGDDRYWYPGKQYKKEGKRLGRHINYVRKRSIRYETMFGNEVGIPEYKHQQNFCVRRRVRKEVLFAHRLTKQGAGAKYRKRNQWSAVRC